MNEPDVNAFGGLQAAGRIRAGGGSRASRRVVGFFLAMILGPSSAGAVPEDSAALPNTTRHSPVERMALPRLKAAHEGVERLAQRRRSLAPLAGWTDYRAIFHAHAEDSAHTGGTRPEMLADAKRAGVSVIFLADHYRPPRDFINDSWRGLREGVLFIPGSEVRGFLVHPADSILGKMDAAEAGFIADVTTHRGLIFLSHIEERPDHPTAGLTGMEIYNRHADAKADIGTLLVLAAQMTDPKSLAGLNEALRLYPDELLAAQVEYPAVYLRKWDADCQQRRLTGVAANDCHHNQVLVVKMVDESTVKIGTLVDPDDKLRSITAAVRPGISDLTRGRKPGDLLARLDFDPYYRSFRNVSTHILAPELTETGIRGAVQAGHAYVGHDWMCDPTGFIFALVGEDADRDDPPASSIVALMGDAIPHAAGRKLFARFPVECAVRLIRNGSVLSRVTTARLEYPVKEPGVYRVEAWLKPDDEERPWIYSNPIYIR
jgi:hypothetical protein